VSYRRLKIRTTIGGRGHSDVRCPRSQLLLDIVGISKAQRWLLIVLAPVGVFAGCYFVWCSIASSSPVQLLAKAYAEQRTLDLRIGKAPHSPIRIQRGPRTSRMDRPESLLDAEAAIARGLRNAPEDGSLLMARGQANLLEWSYEAAITDMQEALDTQPKSAAVLNSLAAAYFERAEAEDRFDDYGTSFELQSRALQQSPDDAIILFNRAITAARLYLYKQSIEDWHRYLSLDASGEWPDEARQHLSEVQGIVDAHDQRTGAPLLTPTEFVQQVDPSDSRTRGTVEPRIEEYLSTAITDWLPAAFPVNGTHAESTQAKQALGILAIILRDQHADSWLTDLLSASASRPFRQAIDALRRAVIADNADYTLGRKEAAGAAQFFSLAGNSAGEIRAHFEEMYALRLSDAGAQCLDHLAKLATVVGNSPYRSLQIRMRLERYSCWAEEGDLQRTDQLATAYKSAQSARYKGLELRILSTLAVDDLLKGKHRSGLARCQEGLRQYWSGSVTSYLGRTLYTAAAFGYDKNEFWHLARATYDQDLAIAAAGEDPLSLAVEHTDLARASLMAFDPSAAQDNLRIAQAWLASAVQSNITENYRLTVESYSALVDGQSGNPHAGLGRLERMRPQLAKIANVNIVADFYRIAGELQGLAGHPEAAERDLTNAVALGEKMRRSLRSESDQVSWMREWAKLYLDLVEVEFQLGKTSNALDVWELYRDLNPPVLPRATSSSAPPATDVETAVTSMQQVLSQESERVRQAFSPFDGQTVLIVGLTPRGVAIWTYDDRGMTAKWLQKNPADLRLQAQRLAELCEQPSSSLNEIHATARQLYKTLVEPASDHLRPVQTLIVQTDETLSAVPFQALVDGAGRYLEDQHPVTYLPVLNYSSLRPRGEHIDAEARALVVASAGGSGDGLRPLADVVTEARAVVHHFSRGQLLVEIQASDSALNSQLSRAEVFHFAGHALGGGGRSGLLLNATDGSGTSALFDAKALRKIPLPKLQLAVLSACSTENGGEGLSEDYDSLARVFLSQGVPHVLATRWNVDSSSSVFLMESFYENLLAGAPVPRALATAESSLRQRAPHPYYWAAFDAFGQD
jgi:CHAT domain-containing protein